MLKQFGIYTGILLLTTLLLWSCGTKQEPKTIYVVRHAEKLLTGDDPYLSVAGTVRSKKLAEILSDKQIEHVFSTDFIRTRATAQPLIEKTPGLTLEIYEVRKHDDLVKELRKRKGNILVVGHSNTIHHVVNYFVEDGEQYPELEDLEYGFIFEITLEKDGSSSVVRREYREFN